MFRIAGLIYLLAGPAGSEPADQTGSADAGSEPADQTGSADAESEPADQTGSADAESEPADQTGSADAESSGPESAAESEAETETETETKTETEPDDRSGPADAGISGSATEPEAEAVEYDGYTNSVIHDPPKRKLKPRHKLVYNNLTAARYNPLGLLNLLTVGWRMQLFQRPGALYEDSYFGVKAYSFVSPAFARVGPRIEIQPLAILNLAATYTYRGNFGTFDQLLSWPTPTAAWDDDTIAERGDNDENYLTGGHLIELAALLQAKVGPIAVRSNFKAYYADYDLRDGDTVYYDQTLDILHTNEGWTVTNDADILYLFENGLKLAVRHTLTHAIYQQKHFLPGEPRSNPNGPTHRLGPGFLYTFYDKPERRFNKPTIFLLAQWWLRHRYRTGANVSAGVPAIALGLLFEGDLLPDPRTAEMKRKKRRNKKRR